MTAGAQADDNHDVLRANLDALGPFVAAAVDRRSGTVRVRCDVTEDGPLLSIGLDGGRWLRLHSSRDPVGEADRLLDAAFANGMPPTIIVVGLGHGFVLEAIERRSSATKVLAIEPVAETLEPLLRRRDWCPWVSSGRLRILVGPDFAGASDAWNMIEGDQPAPAIVTHPVLAREFPRAVKAGCELASRVVAGAQENASARRQFAPRYLLNTLTNLWWVAGEADAGVLREQFVGAPALIAAAGPSLDTNLQDLVRGRFPGLFIAVDTALRPLATAGVPPHLVVGVDPSDLNGRHLTDLPPCPLTRLVGEGSLDQAVARAWRSRSFVFRVSNHHPWPWIRSQGLDVGHLRAWGSVVTTALDLAMAAGCDPIVFIGADLAYTDRLIYCDHTTFDANWAAEGRRVVFERHFALHPPTEVADLHGGTTVTAPHLLHFRDWLVQRSIECAPRRFINATGAGVLFGGRIEQRPLGRMLGAGDSPVSFPQAIAGLWAQSAARRSEAGRTLRAAVDRGPDGTWPLDEWRRFTFDGVDADRMACAVGAARAAWTDGAR